MLPYSDHPGSGKTTILRLIGGFEWATRGEIIFKGLDMKDLPAHMRETSTIFQDYALFPHLSVENNIKYGLRLKRIPKPKESISQQIWDKQKMMQKKWVQEAEMAKQKLDKIQAEYERDLEQKKLPKKKLQKIQDWLDDSDFKYSSWEMYPILMNEKFEKKSIDQLSGGQKQRVALARSLVIEPSILLLDEPLSALDAKIREQMQQLLVDLQKKLGITFLFVTHDREEALRLSDKIAVIREGEVEQYGEPWEIYDFPVNKWVARFIGDSNILKGKILPEQKILALNTELKYLKKYHFSEGQMVDILIRPEDIQIKTTTGIIEGEIATITYKGSYYMIQVQTATDLLLVEATDEYEVGLKVFLDWNVSALHLMKPEANQKAEETMPLKPVLNQTNLNNNQDGQDEKS